MGRPDIKHWWFYDTFRRCLFPALAEETMSLYMHSKLYLFSQTHIYICTYFRRELLKFTSAVVYFSCKTLTGILEWQRWHSKFAAKYHLLLVTANCGKASSNASRMGKYCPRLQIWIPRFPAQFKHRGHCPFSENQQWSEQDGHILLSTPPSFEFHISLQNQPYRIFSETSAFSTLLRQALHIESLGCSVM